MIALYPMTGSAAEGGAASRDDSSSAEDIGRLVRETRGAHGDAIAAWSSGCAGTGCSQGKVVDVARRTDAGFAKAEARIEGVGPDAGSTLVLQVQNEHLVALRDGEVVATVPDLIMVLDAESGEPITTEEMRYGFRVTSSARRATRAGAVRGRARARRAALLRLRHRLRPGRGAVSGMTFVALDTLTWTEAERLGAAGAIGLVALAALEQHGPHLPLATDSLIAERVALEVAARLSGPVVVTPVVRGGLSTHHLAFPGTVTVPPDAYRALVVSYLEGLERMGIRKIALFSWHGGNFSFVQEFVDGWKGEAQLAAYADLNRFIELMMEAAAASALYAPETDVHAGGLETSMMLAAFPELVKPFDQVTGYTEAEPGWLERIFAEGIRPVSETGVLGDVRGANAEAGEAIFAAMADELAGFFADKLQLDRA